VLSDVSEKTGVLPQVLQDFDRLHHMLQVPALRAALARCRTAVTRESCIAQCFVEVLNPSPLVARFLKFMAEQRFLVFFEEIVRYFLAVSQAHMAYQAVTIITATTLKEPTRQTLTHQLQEALGQKVTPVFTVDPTLLSGFKVRIGSKMIDGSFKNHLKHLGNALQGSHL
jgi:F-type H+-transporting ATPase subunit delta